MATYNVTERKKLLNQDGYSLDKEGSSAQAEAKPTTPKYEAYKPSDTVAQAEALLQQHLAQKPGDYTSPWQSRLNDIIQKIQNREKFSYDLNGDALYQQYKDQYMTQGKMAMMDTMGQAQAMTGGYGNSYAQSVGQQAYQGYLQQLNDKVPELYQLALSQYNTEGDAMYNQASLIAGMENQDYGRYRDSVTDYYTELDRLTNDSRYQAEMDYSKWTDNRNFTYQQDRDKVADQQWQAQFDEAKRQYDQQYALNTSKGSGGGNGSGGTTYKAPSGWDTAKIKEFQKANGLTVDGIWGPKTQAAYEASGGSVNSFTGTTYSEAAAYIKANGGSVSGLMDSATWARHKNSYAATGQGNAEVVGFANYQEYLKAFVKYATDPNS